MANNNSNPTRRETLGFGLAAIAATAAVASPAKALSFAGDRATWEAAVARHKALTAQMDRFGDQLRDLHDAAQAACPRRDDFYRRYRLGHADDFRTSFENCRNALLNERLNRAGPLTSIELKEIDAEAHRVVAEFEAYGDRHAAAFAEYDRMEPLFDAVVDQQRAAFKALVATAAPDNAALHYKIELLAGFLAEVDSEDADYLSAIKTDADRLLKVGRA